MNKKKKNQILPFVVIFIDEKWQILSLKKYNPSTLTPPCFPKSVAFSHFFFLRRKEVNELKKKKKKTLKAGKYIPSFFLNK